MAKKAKAKKKVVLTKEDKQTLKDFEVYLVELSKEILGNPTKNIEVDEHIVKVIVNPDYTFEFVSYSNVPNIPIEEQRLLSKAETLNLLIKGAKIKYDNDKN